MTKSRGIRKGRGRDLLARDENGNLIRPRSPRRKPQKITILHGGRSAALSRPIDLRSHVGKRYQADLIAFTAHLGGDLTAPEAKLVDQAARLSLLTDLSWAEVMKTEQLIKDEGPAPAINTFLRSAKELRDVLGILGLNRNTQDWYSHICGSEIQDTVEPAIVGAHSRASLRAVRARVSQSAVV